MLFIFFIILLLFQFCVEGNILEKNTFYGNSTTRTASKFRANLPNFHQIPAYVALFRAKTLNFLLFGQKLLRDEPGFDRDPSHDLRLDPGIAGKKNIINLEWMTAEL